MCHEVNWSIVNYEAILIAIVIGTIFDRLYIGDTQ